MIINIKHFKDTLNENLRLPEEVDLKGSVNYKNIKWNDLKLIELDSNNINYIYLGIQIPGENNKYNKGIIVDLKRVNNIFNQIDILMDINIQGQGLGYQIYKRIIYEFGNIYSPFNKRVNDDAIPHFWNKLKKDKDIEVYSNDVAEIAIWKDIEIDLKKFMKNKFNPNKYIY